MPVTPLAALRRRPVLAGAVTLAVVALAATGTDRAVARYAEQQTADAFQQATRTAQPPTVAIGGFPVLGQVVRGRLDHVEITAHDIPADTGAGRPPISRLDLRLTGVRQSDDERTARSEAARATAFLSYADLSDALGVGITPGDRAGYVDARIQLPLLGAATVTARVGAGPGNSIAFSDLHVVSGDLPAPGMRLLTKVFEQPMPVRNIPQGLHLETLRTSPTGLSAQLAGRDVAFRTDATDDATDAGSGV
ncbi:DUF2993 domain-containing protein [Streptomyces sp. NPDC089919]|uniref:LmeA family phospholipid-binding protein n=1 Tax=Streptomyces sp. NPDC089919 TaxID=3155188 RepID=UPI003442AC2F